LAEMLDPWGTVSVKDYDRLRRVFGIRPFSEVIPKIRSAGLELSLHMKRNILFGHRDFDKVILEGYLKGEKTAVLTGFMLSGRFHFGHKLTADQLIYYQRVFGSKIFIALADAEAYAVRRLPRREAIRLGIEDPDELKKAYEEISSKIPKEKINVILFQEMIEGEIELFIGIKKDPKFGHIMMIGKGGTDVELYRDIEPIMIPFNRKEAGYIFKRTKIAKSVPKELLDKFLDVMIAISTLCIKFPQIKEMDLNPIILNKKGAWIVDAKIFI